MNGQVAAVEFSAGIVQAPHAHLTQIHIALAYLVRLALPDLTVTERIRYAVRPRLCCAAGCTDIVSVVYLSTLAARFFHASPRK